MKFQLFVKRLTDLLVSFISIILLLPFMLIIAILIKTLMPGPIFFTQLRIGKNEKAFKILKFRTMKVDKALEKNVDTSKDKIRTTKLGSILRRFKLDELPQFFNVLKGEMSLVGPRPTISRQVEKYTDFEKQRLLFRPGLTGIAQVKGGIKIPWDERIKMDVDYVKNFNIILDLKIILLTIKVVIFG